MAPEAALTTEAKPLMPHAQGMKSGAVSPTRLSPSKAGAQSAANCWAAIASLRCSNGLIAEYRASLQLSENMCYPASLAGD